MFTGRFDDRISVGCESVLIVLSMFLLSSCNVSIAKSICSLTNIPYDLALSVMSAGFGNNIIILLSVVEIILIVLFIEKLITMIIEKIVWS